MKKKQIGWLAACFAIMVILLTHGNCLASTFSDFTLLDSNGQRGVTLKFDLFSSNGATFEYSVNGGKSWGNLASFNSGGDSQTVRSPRFKDGTHITFAVVVDGTRYTLQQASFTGFNTKGNAAGAVWDIGGNQFEANFWKVRNGDTMVGNKVPIPPTAALLGSGLLGLIGIGWKRRSSEMGSTASAA